MNKAQIQKNKDYEPTEATIDYPGPDELNEPPDDLNYYIKLFFGPKGSGKTTSISQFPDSLTLQMEPKRRGLKIRQTNLQKYSAKELLEGAPDLYQMVVNTTQQWLDDESIQTLNFDSIDIFYEACRNHVCFTHGIEKPSQAGKNSHEVWNEIADEFSSYFDTLHDTEMGINLVSHVKEREETTLEGSKMGFAAPSCTPACLKYLKQAVDISMYQGWYQGERAILVRDDTNSSFVAPGVQGKFLQPDGKELKIFQLPNGDKVYETILAAFNNQLWDMDTPEDERVTKVVPKKSSKAAPSRGGPPKRRPTKKKSA